MNDLYLLTILLLILACGDKNMESRGGTKNMSCREAGKLALPALPSTSLKCQTRGTALGCVDGTPEDLGKVLIKLLGKPIGIVIDGHTFEGTVVFVKNRIVFLRGATSMGWFDWTKASGLIMSC